MCIKRINIENQLLNEVQKLYLKKSWKNNSIKTILTVSVKRSQDILGGNLTRDSRKQVALNNALKSEEGAVIIAAPSWFYSSPPAHALKNPP